ncbi:hypothetical protein BDV12DRAFT_205493 [Aspergillus spectabilis]
MSFPAFIALLAGLTLLYRVYTHQTPPKATPPKVANTTTVTKESNYPQDYLISPQTFSLEHRAIFSKTWIPLSHTTHFPKPGSYSTYTLPNAPLVLIKGKDHVIRAFHNVCRHRAYPVTRRECGSSTVLACRYHGWSYNTLGELIKAPAFDGVEGFEREVNGLFEVGVRVGGEGIVWVNVEVKGEGEGREEGGMDVKGLEGILRGNKIEMGSGLVGGGVVEGGFNWKVALRRSYLEIALGLEDQNQGYLSFLQNVLRYFQRKPESIYLFPNAFLFTIPSLGCWLYLSFLPYSERMTSVRFDLYSQGGEKDQASQFLLSNLEIKIKTIVSDLETEYQSCIDASDPTSILSDLDQESSGTQIQILSLLKAHTKLEKFHGEEIYPARREPRRNTNYEQAEQLCKELEFGDSKCLAW